MDGEVRYLLWLMLLVVGTVLAGYLFEPRCEDDDEIDPQEE